MKWYRQFWPWVLIALPASAVVAGFATLYIAAADPDGLVADDYYRQGLAINQDFERRRKAEAQGLGGEFAFDAQTGMGSLKLAGVGTAPERINLRLAHLTRADKDITAVLYRDLSGKLSGTVGFPDLGRWQVIVEAPDGAWRLGGILELPGRSRVELDPN